MYHCCAADQVQSVPETDAFTSAVNTYLYYKTEWNKWQGNSGIFHKNPEKTRCFSSSCRGAFPPWTGPPSKSPDFVPIFAECSRKSGKTTGKTVDFFEKSAYNLCVSDSAGFRCCPRADAAAVARQPVHRESPHAERESSGPGEGQRRSGGGDACGTLPVPLEAKGNPCIFCHRVPNLGGTTKRCALVPKPWDGSVLFFPSPTNKTRKGATNLWQK